jgi:hypothetical protein
LLTAVEFALCDARVCIEGAIVLLLFVEVGYICNIVIRNNTYIFVITNVTDTYINSSR